MKFFMGLESVKMTDFLVFFVECNVVWDLLDFLRIRDCYVLSFISSKYRKFFLEAMQTKIDRSLKDQLRKSLGADTERFLSILHESKGAIGGSFLLRTVLEEEWELNPSDVNVFLPGYSCSKYYKPIEEFLVYRSLSVSSKIGDLGDFRYETRDLDSEVLNFSVDSSQADPIGNKLYVALQEKDLETVEECWESLEIFFREEFLSADERKRSEIFCQKFILGQEVSYEKLRWACFSLYTSRLGENKRGTIFQTIRRFGKPRDLKADVFESTDFKFCKIVASVNEEGNFVTEAKSWPSIFNKKCNFPDSKINRLPSTILRFLKYSERGFLIRNYNEKGLAQRLFYNCWYGSSRESHLEFKDRYFSTERPPYHDTKAFRDYFVTIFKYLPNMEFKCRHFVEALRSFPI